MAEKYPQTTVVEKPININQKMTDKEKEAMTACSQKDWNKLFSILNKDSYIINSFSETGHTPLHHVALSGDITAMNRMLNYPSCNQGTLKIILSGDYQLSNEMKYVLELKIRKMKLENISMPILTETPNSNKLLNNYLNQALAACKGNSWRVFEIEKSLSFHEACWFVFYALTMDTISTIRNALNRELVNQGIPECGDCTMDEFCNKLLQIYTEYGLSNNSVREICNQKSGHSTIYVTLLNTVLLYWTGLNRCRGTTYRGVRIPQSEIDAYRVGREINWLVFVSCSIKIVSDEFEGNCVFQIDNSVECQWCPGYLGNGECVYPCGSQFQVVKVEKKGVKMWIYLKLMQQSNTETLPGKLKSVLSKSAANIKTEYSKLRVYQVRYVTESKSVFDKNRAQQIKNQTRKIDKKEVILKEGEFAYNCSVCKETCHMECNDVKIGLCHTAIDKDTGGCNKCPGKCHYLKHKRQRFKIEVTEREKEIEPIDTTKLEQTELELKAKLKEFENLKTEFYRTADYLDSVLDKEGKKAKKGHKELIRDVEAMKKSISAMTLM